MLWRRKPHDVNAPIADSNEVNPSGEAQQAIVAKSGSIGKAPELSSADLTLDIVIGCAHSRKYRYYCVCLARRNVEARALDGLTRRFLVGFRSSRPLAAAPSRRTELTSDAGLATPFAPHRRSLRSVT